MPQRLVLIADDEEICLTITSAMVKKIGLPVLLARDGLEAVEMFEKHGKAIGSVLIDLQMPRMNGMEAFRRIREMDEKMPVIIITGCQNGTNLELLASLNPAGYIKKPVSFDDLSALLMP